jgi:hypothetical protein
MADLVRVYSLLDAPHDLRRRGTFRLIYE